MSIYPYNKKDQSKKSFGAKWTHLGKRSFKFFETEKERDAFIRQFKSTQAKTGPALFELSAADAVIMRECIKMVGSSADVLRVVSDHAKRIIPTSTTMLAAKTAYLTEKTNAGYDEDYIRHLKFSLSRLPDIAPATLTDEQAAQLIGSLPLAPRTVTGHIKNFRAFWSWMQERSFVSSNVFRRVPLPKIPEKEPEFLTIEQATTLLSTALQHYPDAVAYFVLGLFAGLRSSACVRIDPEHIRFEQRGILITGENAKNARRQFVDGHEPNLWTWLEWCQENAPEGFDLPARLWERRREQIAKLAKVKMPHNALRHSFCTYHCALHGDAGKTATLLTHRGNVAILYQHYKGNATRTDAQAYFALTPAAFR